MAFEEEHYVICLEKVARGIGKGKDRLVRDQVLDVEAEDLFSKDEKVGG